MEKGKWAVVFMVIAICSLIIVGCVSSQKGSSEQPTVEEGSSEQPTVEEGSSEQPTVEGNNNVVETKFPEREITIYVGYAAGGVADLMTRELGAYITKETGVPVVVVNKPGGGGCIAVSETLAKEPDGYHLAFASTGNLLINPVLSDLGYTYKDVTPVGKFVFLPTVVAVKADSQFETFDDLMEYAKNNPNKVVYAGAGANTQTNILMENAAMLNGGAKLNFLPNTSNPESIAQLLGGHIDAYCINIGSIKDKYEDGSVRLLAITSSERLEDMPDVPTFKELGYDNFELYSGYFSYVAPKGLSEDVIAKFDELLAGAAGDPDIIKGYDNLNLPIVHEDFKTFEQSLKPDAETFETLLEELGFLK